jgi:hypothetical protein
VKEKLGLSYNNSRSLNQVINELPALAEWNLHKLTLDDSETTESIELWCRDPTDALKSLWGSPALFRFMKFMPEKQYTNSKTKKRLYNEMNTGNWWWNKQASVVYQAVQYIKN